MGICRSGSWLGSYTRLTSLQFSTIITLRLIMLCYSEIISIEYVDFLKGKAQQAIY